MRLTLTKQTEYALRILLWIAREEAGAPSGANGEQPRQKAAAIATGARIPAVFATRILSQLQRQGLLHARAGQHGGYTLARRPTDVSLLDVIEAVEGPLVTQTCVLREMACGADGFCLLHGAWSAAQTALRDVLAQTSLADAVAP